MIHLQFVSYNKVYKNIWKEPLPDTEIQIMHEDK